MATKPPPPLLKASVQRFYGMERPQQVGLPTVDQVRYETSLQAYLTLLSVSYLPLTGASLPTTNPHKVGSLWNNAGVVTVSAG